MTPATTQITQLCPQLFVDRLYPTYTAVAIIQYAVYTAYWIIATAVYVGYSLSTNNWGQSWVIWVVAGVMFPAIIAITNAFDKKSK